MSRTHSHAMRWLHVALFALAPVLSAGVCDCCERGPCPERCRMRLAKDLGCCCSATPREGGVASCCSKPVDAPHYDRAGGRSYPSGKPCACWLEPKESPSGQEVRDDDLIRSTTPKIAGFGTLATDDVWIATASVRVAIQAGLSNLIPRRPARILYGVWRN